MEFRASYCKISTTRMQCWRNTAETNRIVIIVTNSAKSKTFRIQHGLMLRKQALAHHLIEILRSVGRCQHAHSLWHYYGKRSVNLLTLGLSLTLEASPPWSPSQGGRRESEMPKHIKPCMKPTLRLQSNRVAEDASTRPAYVLVSDICKPVSQNHESLQPTTLETPKS